jgi:beta-mannanase
MTAHRDRIPDGSAGVWDVYPGDSYVDVVSIDAYDFFPASVTQKIWDTQCNFQSGLCSVIKFAREHRKPFAVPEWGLVRSSGGGGDNPFFIQKMYEVFAANADILAYEAYYNNAEPDNVRSSLYEPVLNPDSGKRYRELFGAN